MSAKKISTLQGLLALSPVAVFLLSYVAVSVIAGDFYSMPIAVSLVLASVYDSYNHLRAHETEAAI